VQSTNEELHNYFDHYLDGIENDWKKDKPKVRWLAFQLGDREAIDVVEYADFPIPGTRPQCPFNAYDTEEEITPGKIVRLEVGVWAMSVKFDAGESISVRVGGKYPSITEFQAWSKFRPEEEKNKGRHKIHIGTIHSSSIILPFVPL
jgi:predicted acyl esterase